MIPLALPEPVPPVRTPATGTLTLPGPGTGAGAAGFGPGGGGKGSSSGGDGDAGPASPAVQLSGKLSARDLPRDVLLPGGSLSVGVAYTVGVDGRVRDCAVTASSGYPEADALVCRLLTGRFRYRPARDRAGNPVPSPVRETHSWARRAAPASAPLRVAPGAPAACADPMLC
jgi:protein TonB